MTACNVVREWLPWYVTGSMDFATAERIASTRNCPRSSVFTSLSNGSTTRTPANGRPLLAATTTPEIG